MNESLIPNPQSPIPNMDTLTLKLRGMSCAACANNIEKAIRSVPGVRDCNVNFGVEQAAIKYDRSLANLEKIQSAIASAGYSSYSLQEELLTEEDDAEIVSRQALQRESLKVAVGGVISIFLFLGKPYSFSASHWNIRRSISRNASPLARANQPISSY